jgi:hypothetical protein
MTKIAQVPALEALGMNMHDLMANVKAMKPREDGNGHLPTHHLASEISLAGLAASPPSNREDTMFTFSHHLTISSSWQVLCPRLTVRPILNPYGPVAPTSAPTVTEAATAATASADFWPSHCSSLSTASSDAAGSYRCQLPRPIRNSWKGDSPWHYSNV